MIEARAGYLEFDGKNGSARNPGPADRQSAGDRADNSPSGRHQEIREGNMRHHGAS
jgi:hypothetical protein